MKKFEPIRGVSSQRIAREYLERYWEHYNDSRNKICPLINLECCEDDCMSWVEATTYLSNPGRLEESESIYDIRPGYCKCPLVTGKLVGITEDINIWKRS